MSERKLNQNRKKKFIKAGLFFIHFPNKKMTQNRIFDDPIYYVNISMQILIEFFNIKITRTFQSYIILLSLFCIHHGYKL